MSQIYCSRCGAEVPQNATYCPHCGQLIGGYTTQNQQYSNSGAGRGFLGGLFTFGLLHALFHPRFFHGGFFMGPHFHGPHGPMGGGFGGPHHFH